MGTIFYGIGGILSYGQDGLLVGLGFGFAMIFGVGGDYMT